MKVYILSRQNIIISQRGPRIGSPKHKVIDAKTGFSIEIDIDLSFKHESSHLSTNFRISKYGKLLICDKEFLYLLRLTGEYATSQLWSGVHGLDPQGLTLPTGWVGVSII